MGCSKKESLYGEGFHWVRARQVSENQFVVKRSELPMEVVLAVAPGQPWLAEGGRFRRPVRGASPRSFSIRLASQTRLEPYSQEELANPFVQNAIAQCERQGGGEGCQGRLVPANTRTDFVRTQDKEVFAMVTLGGVEPNRDYEVRFGLFDPDSNLRTRYTIPFHASKELPAEGHVHFNFSWAPTDPNAWQLGRWRIEITVNGKVEGERTFNVVDVAPPL